MAGASAHTGAHAAVVRGKALLRALLELTAATMAERAAAVLALAIWMLMFAQGSVPTATCALRERYSAPSARRALVGGHTVTAFAGACAAASAGTGTAPLLAAVMRTADMATLATLA